jgi:hypothetical protein
MVAATEGNYSDHNGGELAPIETTTLSRALITAGVREAACIGTIDSGENQIPTTPVWHGQAAARMA